MPGQYKDDPEPTMLHTPWSEEAMNLGMAKIKSILGGEYDPTTSPYFKGLKQEAKTITEEGTGSIKQRGQMGGMLYSEPAMGIESEFTGKVGTGLLKTLGGLYESNIARETSMIPALAGFADIGTWTTPTKTYEPGLGDYMLPLVGAMFGGK